MDALSPAVADAFALLREDLDEHLCEADALAYMFEWSEVDSDRARTLISDLVVVIRGLLMEHKPQPTGGCRTCSSAWPCPVVTTIHGLVKDPDRTFAALLSQTRNGK
ncbi:MAG: hypothetical protein ACRDQ4_19190 [Pseudonocardiaceae bacterium]